MEKQYKKSSTRSKWHRPKQILTKFEKTYDNSVRSQECRGGAYKGRKIRIGPPNHCWRKIATIATQQSDRSFNGVRKSWKVANDPSIQVKYALLEFTRQEQSSKKASSLGATNQQDAGRRKRNQSWALVRLTVPAWSFLRQDTEITASNHIARALL